MVGKQIRLKIDSYTKDLSDWQPPVTGNLGSRRLAGYSVAALVFAVATINEDELADDTMNW